MTAPPRAALVQGCLNGRRTRSEHPFLPLLPDELAREARASVLAGARSIHVHPRAVDGRETLEAEPRAAALQALRAACPGIELTFTTGHWIEQDVARRLERVRRWTAVPDLASVNIAEPGAAELCRVLGALGVRIEVGVAEVADVERLARSDLGSLVARVLVEVEGEADRALATAEAIDLALDASGMRAPRLHHGYGAATWRVIDRALECGHDVRVGLEDTLVLPAGRLAGGNAELVAECVARAARQAGRDVPAGVPG